MTDNSDPSAHANPEDRSLISQPGFLALSSPASDTMDDGSGAKAGTGALSAYLHAFRRRWFVSLSVGILCGISAAAIAWFTHRDQYTATVAFRVAASPESLIFEDRRAARDDFEIYKSTQQQLIRTDYVITASLRPKSVNNLRIVAKQKDADRWLAESIVTSFPREGEVMTVSVPADTPDATALLTASVAKAYIDEVVDQEKSNRSARYSELKVTLQNKNEERDTKNRELQELAKKLGSNDSQALSNQQRVAQEHWMAVYREWILVQNEVLRLETAFQLGQSELSRVELADANAQQALVSPYELETAQGQDPILAELKLELEGIRANIEEVRRTSTAIQLSRHEQSYKTSLEEIQNRISLRQTQIEQSLRRHALAMMVEEVARLKSELDTQQRLEKRLREDEEKLRDSVKEFGGSSLIVENLQKEIDALERIIDPMDKQARELEIELRRPNRVTRITRLKSELETEQVVADSALKLEELAQAIRPHSADRNSRVKKTAGAGVAVLCLTIAGILYLEVRAQRVNSSVDVSDSLGLSVIGAIPFLPTRAVNSLGYESNRYRRWRTLLSESMRGVMVRLVHDTPPGESRVVMVSSASSGEGKSTLATNLAVAMARAGYRTLLVDFDLRRPSLDELFDVPAEPGVSEMLRNEAMLEDTINAVEPANLSVVSAGHWSPHDVSALANGTTENLFTELRDQFQYVIVDGAPILGVAESQLLCRYADTVLFSVLRDVSSGPRIMAACETLANFGVRSLYAVVTGTSSVDHEAYYSEYSLDGYED